MSAKLFVALEDLRREIQRLQAELASLKGEHEGLKRAVAQMQQAAQHDQAERDAGGLEPIPMAVPGIRSKAARNGYKRQ